MRVSGRMTPDTVDAMAHDPQFLEAMRADLIARHAWLMDALARRDTETPAVTPDGAIGRLTRVDAMQMGM